MPTSIVTYLILLVITFLLGSIPWGLIISRVLYKTDIREHGSGNIGTTNALRALGKRGGAAVFILDFAKGLVSGVAALVAIALLWPGEAAAPLLVAIETGSGSGVATIDANALRAVALAGCVLGHVFSPWLGFKGGKGIATGVGCVFIAFGPVGALIELLIFAVLTAVTRYVSVGSMGAALAFPFCALWFMQGSWLAIGLCAVMAAVVLWAHRGNIARLLAREESRIGSKAAKAAKPGPTRVRAEGQAQSTRRKVARRAPIRGADEARGGEDKQ